MTVRIRIAVRQGISRDPSIQPSRIKQTAPPPRPKKVAIQACNVVRMSSGNQSLETLLSVG